MVGIGGLIWVGGMFIGLYELVMWLKTGIWPSNTLADVFGAYTVKDWSGITQIMVWLWSQPLWSVVGCVGMIIAIWGIAFENS